MPQQTCTCRRAVHRFRSSILVTALAVTAVLVSSCGGQGGSGGGVTRTPTRSLASPVASAPEAASPPRPEASQPVPEPTQSHPRPSFTAPEHVTVTAEPSTVTATATASRAPTRAAQLPSSSPGQITAAASPSAIAVPPTAPVVTAATTAPATTTSETSVSSAWAWLLLFGILLASGIGVWLSQRSAKRRTWEAGMSGATSEVAWLARHLLPQLTRAASPAQLALVWGAQTQRVAALEETLAGLQVTAPDEVSGGRARRLADAVRQARGRVDLLVLADSLPPDPNDLWAVVDELEAALSSTMVAPTPTAPGGTRPPAGPVAPHGPVAPGDGQTPPPPSPPEPPPPRAARS